MVGKRERLPFLDVLLLKIATTTKLTQTLRNRSWNFISLNIWSSDYYSVYWQLLFWLLSFILWFEFTWLCTHHIRSITFAIWREKVPSNGFNSLLFSRQKLSIYRFFAYRWKRWKMHKKLHTQQKKSMWDQNEVDDPEFGQIHPTFEHLTIKRRLC